MPRRRHPPRHWLSLGLACALLACGPGLVAAAAAEPPAPPPAAAPVPDDALYTALLADHVVAGQVRYATLRTDPRLATYLATLAQTDPARLPTPAAQIALWLNAYNAYTLDLVARQYPIQSIHELAWGGRIIGFLVNRTPWHIRFARVGGQTYTLDEVEHQILRKQFAEPRIHFALVCAARSCPPLRPEAYRADTLDAQLDDQARRFLADPRHNRFDPTRREAHVSEIFNWFKRDFGPDDTAVLAFLARYTPPGLPLDPPRWRLRHLPYDWALNDVPATTTPANPTGKEKPPATP